MKLRLYAALLILLMASSARAEEKETFGLWYLDAAFKYAPMGNVIRGGKGFSLDAGVNLGRIAGKSVLFAPYISLSPLWGGEWTGDFKKDLAANYPTPSTDNTWFGLIDEMKKGSTRGGDLQFSYGILFKLPYRYFPATKIYKIGIDSFGVYHPYSPLICVGSGCTEDVTSINRKGWGVEALVYSLTHGNIGYTSVRFGYISLFGEWFDIEHAEVSDVPTRFKDHVNSGLFRKYGNEWRLGMKIGLNLM